MNFRSRFVVLAAIGSMALSPAWAAQQPPAAWSQPASGVQSRPASARDQRLQAALDAWRQRVDVPGATLGFALPDGSAGAVATGMACTTTSAPMKPRDRMSAGSIGKTFFAAVVLQLVAEKKLDLDAPLARTLGGEEWYSRLPNAPDLTLRMLMNHTSGLREHVISPEFLEAIRREPLRAWKPTELIAFALDREPLFPAGQGWAYADTNYIVVGILVEKVTGRDCYDLVRERILKPLKLEDTIPATGPDLPGLVSGYAGPQMPFPVPREVSRDGRFSINPQFEWTGGGFVSSAYDLARWARQAYAGDVIPAALRPEMLKGKSSSARTGGAHDEYGLGVQIYPSRLGRVLGHAGYFPGYVSQMAYFEESGVAVAVQINTDDRPQRMKMRELLDEMAEILK